MIPLQFGLWHSGVNLSYLRYLTFKTLRYFHPDSKIQLFLGSEFKKDGHRWGEEKQDFEDASAIQKDYIDKLKDINVEVIKVDWFSHVAPNFQSDLFRYWYLKNISGFYLDTDQIILKSFNGLPLDNDFIYSGYEAASCGYYTPVGVLGSAKNVEIVDFIHANITKFINPNNYNSAGPFMFREVIKYKQWKDKIFNAPSNYFYPIPDSYLVESIYNGTLKLNSESFALHLFLGHPKSQEFNKKYTEEFAKTSNDTISRFLRENSII
jgi:hypothetical protein